MAIEYKIIWQKPEDYYPTDLMKSLPSPISRKMAEIYNFSIVEDGFYFIDNLEDARVASYALKLFLDEALMYTNQVEVQKL